MGRSGWEGPVSESGRVGSGQGRFGLGLVCSGPLALGENNLEGQLAMGERNVWSTKNSTTGKHKRKTQSENTSGKHFVKTQREQTRGKHKRKTQVENEDRKRKGNN